ncbi:MAG TPA: restriction endonuclease subunit S, partial [Gallionella sp.]|nr:restriction endonuclease subunit S [Gallionella sp.]
LIVAMTEQGEGLLGSAARIPGEGKYLHNQRLGLVEIIAPDVFDKQFLYWALNSPTARAQIRATATGAKVRHTAPERIKKVLVPVPGVREQRAIALVLDSYDDLIATNQRRIQLLEDAARRLYREWFVHLRFPGHESVKVKDGVPEGWTKMPLGDLAPLSYGKALKATERQDGEVPVYGSSGIVGTHNKALIESGAIIVGRKGNVGSLYFSPVPCFPIDTVFFIAPEQASYWLYLALHQFNFVSSDAAVPGLNRNYAHGLQIVWPDAETRSAFETQAGPMFEQIQNLTQWNAELAKARDLLLPKLMSGQLDVSGIALPDEVAA